MIINTTDLHARYSELEFKIEVSPLSLDSTEQNEWNKLLELESSISDFWYGKVMVPEDEFTAYAKQLAEDLDYTGRNVEGQSWPYNHIDWESAANELRQDYFEFEWQGQTYLVEA